jgi:hypothetical protein
MSSFRWLAVRRALLASGFSGAIRSGIHANLDAAFERDALSEKKFAFPPQFRA